MNCFDDNGPFVIKTVHFLYHPNTCTPLYQLYVGTSLSLLIIFVINHNRYHLLIAFIEQCTEERPIQF